MSYAALLQYRHCSDSILFLFVSGVMGKSSPGAWPHCTMRLASMSGWLWHTDEKKHTLSIFLHCSLLFCILLILY